MRLVSMQDTDIYLNHFVSDLPWREDESGFALSHSAGSAQVSALSLTAIPNYTQ
ncbi:MAG: hypothetical protein J07HQX50_01191 [Haloquadratum sp. J07HQX50]|nr:MAG: hypothetical protein J07HQX50_01191 [Haloquadratum sp. J07HQX50]